MDDEIQVISDGDGFAVIGNPATVDRFLTSERLSSKDLGLKRLRSALSAGKETLGRSRSAMGKLSSGIAERAVRQRGNDGEG